MKNFNKSKIKSMSVIFVILGILLAIYTLFMIYLMCWGFFASLKAELGSTNLFRGNEIGLPEGMPWNWQWSNYKVILKYIYVDEYLNGARVRIGLMDMLINTLIITFGGATISTFVPCLVAYVTTKFDFKFSAVFDAIILIVMIIPIVGAYLSEIQVLNTLGLYDTWAGFFLQKTHCISVYYLVFKAVFKSISMSYSEAAYVEGAGEYTVMFRIVIPLAKTVILTIFLIYFISYWNDYNTPLLYLKTKPTLAFGIYHIVFGQAENVVCNVPMRMAGSFLLFSPVIILFSFFRKSIMQNLSMGGVKE